MYRNMQQQQAYPQQQQMMATSQQSVPQQMMQPNQQYQTPIGAGQQPMLNQQQIINQQRQQMYLNQQGMVQQPAMQQYQQPMTQQPMMQGVQQGFGVQATNCNTPQQPNTSTSRYSRKNRNILDAAEPEQQAPQQEQVCEQPVRVQQEAPKIYPMLGNEFEPLATKNILIEKQVMGDNFKYAIMGKVDNTVLTSKEFSPDEVDVISDPITKNLTRISLALDMKDVLAGEPTLDAVYQTIGIADYMPITDKKYSIYNAIKTSENMHELAINLKRLLTDTGILSDAYGSLTKEDKLYLNAVNEYLTKSVMLAIKLGLNESEKISSFMDDYDDLMNIYKKVFGDSLGVIKRYEFSFDDILHRLKLSVETFREVYDSGDDSSSNFKEGVIIDPIGYMVINSNSQLLKATVLEVFKDLDGTKAIREDVLPSLHKLISDAYDEDITKMILVIDDDAYLVRGTVSGYYTITKL